LAGELKRSAQFGLQNEVDMKAIIVIKIAHPGEYEIVRDDLERQMKERGWDLPIFCRLNPNLDFGEEIDVVWIDDDIEKEKFIEIIRQQRGGQDA